MFAMADSDPDGIIAGPGVSTQAHDDNGVVAGPARVAPAVPVLVALNLLPGAKTQRPAFKPVHATTEPACSWLPRSGWLLKEYAISADDARAGIAAKAAEAEAALEPENLETTQRSEP